MGIGFGAGGDNINPGYAERMGDRRRKGNRGSGELVVLGEGTVKKGGHGRHCVGLGIGDGQIEVSNQVMGKYTAGRATDNIQGCTMARRNGVELYEDFADARR